MILHLHSYASEDEKGAFGAHYYAFGLHVQLGAGEGKVLDMAERKLAVCNGQEE